MFTALRAPTCARWPTIWAKTLGCGAHLVGLRRTKSGRFTLRDAVPLRKLQEAFEDGNWYQYLIPAAEALSDWPAVELTEEEDRHHPPRSPHSGPAGQPQLRRAGSAAMGELVALLDFDAETSEWQPKKVFFS